MSAKDMIHLHACQLYYEYITRDAQMASTNKMGNLTITKK